MVETKATSPNTQGMVNKLSENDSRGSHVAVLPSKKPNSKLRAWIERQKIGVKLWLYKYLVLAGLGFVGLNTVDAQLTNYAHRLVGVTGIEANPFMQPFVGSWVLSFKGVIGLGAIGLIAYARKVTPNKLFWWLVFGCAVFLGVILWNLRSLGVIG